MTTIPGLLLFLWATAGFAAFSAGEQPAVHRGVHEVTLVREGLPGNPCLDIEVGVVFTRPDRSLVAVEAFYDGEGRWRARAYCDRAGPWAWRSTSDTDALNNHRGAFEVQPSDLPGKLRQHPADPFQFARDDGSWFLH